MGEINRLVWEPLIALNEEVIWLFIQVHWIVHYLVRRNLDSVG